MDEERRQRRAQRDVNWGLIAGRAALERDGLVDTGLPSTDRELVRVLKRGVIFGAVCGTAIVGGLAWIAWAVATR